MSGGRNCRLSQREAPSELTQVVTTAQRECSRSLPDHGRLMERVKGFEPSTFSLGSRLGGTLTLCGVGTCGRSAPPVTHSVREERPVLTTAVSLPVDSNRHEGQTSLVSTSGLGMGQIADTPIGAGRNKQSARVVSGILLLQPRDEVVAPAGRTTDDGSVLGPDVAQALG